ncbi:MAG: hypothetical protein R3E01_30210 [Pirellulaceae bacterium]
MAQHTTEEGCWSKEGHREGTVQVSTWFGPLHLAQTEMSGGDERMSLGMSRFALASIWLLAAVEAVGAETPSAATVSSGLSGFSNQCNVGWRDYLELKEIREQLTRGADANKELVGRVIMRLNGTDRGPDTSAIEPIVVPLRRWQEEAERVNGAHSRVRRAYETLNEWLSSDDTRYPKWRDYLRSDDMEEQLSAGAKASADTVKAILDQYSGESPVLLERRFRAVRDALAKWHEQLTTAASQPEVDVDGLIDAIDTALDDRDDALNRDSRTAGTWREYFMDRELTRAINSPEDADPQELARILQRYQGYASAPGLVDRKLFRRQLTNWLAELQEPIDDFLAQRVRAAKSDYTEFSEQRVAGIRARLQTAMRNLQNKLGRISSSKLAGWQRFLLWPELERELNADSDVQLRKLSEVLDKYQSGEPGLQLAEFYEVRRQLQNLIDALQIRETSVHRFEQSRSEVTNALNDLDRYLQGGGEEREEGWKKFLEWDELQELWKENPTDLRAINRFAQLYASDQPGLKRAPFARVARALTKYIEMQQLQVGPDAQDIYASRLEFLAQYVRNLRTEERTHYDAAQIGQRLEWLETVGQAPGLVQQIRQSFSQPNLQISISGQLLTGSMNRPVNDTSPIPTRRVDRATISGTATTRGWASGALVPSANGVVLDVMLNGNTQISTVGTTRPVNVYVGGNTQLTGTKRLHVTLSGIMDEPARGAACTQTYVQAIQPKRRLFRRLVTRIARRKTNESLPQGNWEASQTAANKIVEQMEQQSQQLLQQARAQYDTQVLQPLARINRSDYPLKKMHLYSTSNSIEFRAEESRPWQLSAASPPPMVPQSAGEITVRVHESLINNVAQQTLGGVKLTSERVVELLEKNNIEVPESLRMDKSAKEAKANGESRPSLRQPYGSASGAGTPRPAAASGADNDDNEDPGSQEEEEDKNLPWSITFDPLQPVAVKFSNQQIKVAIRGSEFIRGDNIVDEPVEVSAVYSIERTSNGYVFRRSGDVQVEFLDRGSRKPFAIVNTMRRRFEDLFQMEMSTDDLPKNGPLSRLSSVQVLQLDVISGWILAGVHADVQGAMRGASTSVSAGAGW